MAGFYTISNSIKLGRALHVTDFANDINALTTTDADYFSQHYIDPKKVTIIPPSEKENLILIYIESLEDSYKNPAFFGRNLLADLNPFEKDGLSLRLNVVGTTTYTAGAHFAVSCGVVSKPVLFNNMSANQQEKMIKTVFQNALCLSDILKANGYYNVFMVSSNDRTGGLGNFYQTHHFDEIYSLSYWQTHGYGYVAHWQNHSYSSTSIQKQGKWGIYDKYILEEGYKKLAALQEKRDHDGQPFFLTITTIDIHPPADSSCTANIANDEKKPFDKVVECTAANLAIFLKNSQQNNLFKNSKVLI
ncbi:MAG: sulfatase-like hydrolase/transferase, partial [Alphaproteobacteria bacterium]|nr:sulfatase-like hydrolase/transferase [Alphaproteobacteria bacterium]